MVKLGEKVKDIVTGISGIAVAKVHYLNGCIQFCVQPRAAMDALKTDSLYIDEGQLEKIGDGINVPKAKVTKRIKPQYGGGPSAHAPQGLKHP